MPAPSSGLTIWLTGLSGAGKTTLAHHLHRHFLGAGRRSEILDGDEMRRQFGGTLGFTKADRDLNVQRIGTVARLLARNDVVVIVAAMSPYRATREAVRREHETPFAEVHVDCGEAELRRRDTKGLYAASSQNLVEHLSGVSAPYESPANPEVYVRTDRGDAASCYMHILTQLGRLFPDRVSVVAAATKLA